MKYEHKEAFTLMWYACNGKPKSVVGTHIMAAVPGCGHRERIWNSRDGVTPFGCACPSCGKKEHGEQQMSNLIEQLRKAKRPSVQLDRRIQIELNFSRGGNFTSSIDEALRLVPEDARWYVADSDEDGGDPVASVWKTEDMIATGIIPKSEGATAAIALCIAVLKARQAPI